MLRFLAVVVMLIAASTPACAAWKKAVSPGFVIYGENSDKELLSFTRKVERFDAFLRNRFSLPQVGTPYRIPIFMVGSETDVGLIRSNQKAPNLGGFFTVGPYGPMAVVQRKTADEDGANILFHEYVHSFMYRHFNAAFPAWFVEGFAEFYSTTTFDRDGKASYGLPPLHRAYSLLVEKPIPIETLLGSTVDELKNDEERGVFYGRAWVLTHFLSFEPSRQGQLEKYLGQINSGVDGMEAARAVFGDLKKLDKDLTAYVKRSKISIYKQTNVTAVPDQIAIVALDQAESQITPDLMMLMKRPNDEQMAALKTRLQAARAKYPNSVAVATLLAQTCIFDEDYKSAQAAADSALAKEPGNVAALLAKVVAETQLLSDANVTDAAKWKAARSFIIKANRADPENPYPLYHYYQSIWAEGEVPSKLAEDGLEKAMSIVPQDWRIRSAYIRMLVRHRELASAIAALKPIAYSPHGGSEADSARNYILDLQMQMKADAAVEKPEPPKVADPKQKGK